MKWSDQLQAPAALPQANNPSTHWIRDWVGSRVGLASFWKAEHSCPCHDSSPGPSSR